MQYIEGVFVGAKRTTGVLLKWNSNVSGWRKRSISRSLHLPLHAPLLLRGSEQTSHGTQQTKQFQTRESSVMTGLRSVLCCLPGRSSKRQQQPGGSVARGPFPSDGMLRQVGVCTSVAAADHPVITQRVRSVEGKRAFIWPVSGGMCSLG